MDRCNKKIKGNIRNRNVHDARIGHTRAELHDVGMSRHVENNDLRRIAARVVVDRSGVQAWQMGYQSNCHVDLLR